VRRLALVVLPEVFGGATLQKKTWETLEAWSWKCPRTQRLAMSGVKDGSVRTMLHPQADGIAGNRGAGRSDIVRPFRAIDID
jgi:hypothetical protein